MAVIANGEQEKAEEMALDWLNEKVFHGSVGPITPGELAVDQALLICKQYQVIRSYLHNKPLPEIRTELEYADISDTDQLLRVFNAKRAAFLAQTADKLDNYKARKSLVEEIAGLFRASFLTIDQEVVGNLIKTKKEMEEKFQVEAANVTSMVAGICIREAVRCVAYAAGFLGLEKEQSLGNNPLPPSLYAECLTYFTELVE